MVSTGVEEVVGAGGTVVATKDLTATVLTVGVAGARILLIGDIFLNTSHRGRGRGF